MSWFYNEFVVQIPIFALNHYALLNVRLSVLKIIDLGQLFVSIGLQADYNYVMGTLTYIKIIWADYNVDKMITNFSKHVKHYTNLLNCLPFSKLKLKFVAIYKPCRSCCSNQCPIYETGAGLFDAHIVSINCSNASLICFHWHWEEQKYWSTPWKLKYK